MSKQDLLAQLDKLPPEKREALLKKLKAKKQQATTQPSAQPSIPTLDRAQYKRFPLSFAQQRLWFLDKLDSSTAFYNLAAAIEMDGTLDVDALQDALHFVIDRHETLRTTFTEEQGEAYQVVHPVLPTELHIVDISHLDAQAQKVELETIKRRDAQTLFDLNQGPLLKTSLVKLSDQQQTFLLTLHHIIADGWSAQCFAQELSQAYRAIVTKQTPNLPALTIQYADFAHWQRHWLQGEVLKQQSDYWQQQLSDTPTLSLPLDYPRPPVQTYKGKTHTVELNLAQKTALMQLAQNQQGTLYMAMLALFEVFIHRYTQQDDFAIGTPVANRTRTELEPLVGFFVNTLAVRATLTGHTNFNDLLNKVKQDVIGAQSHQDLPFERLVELLGIERDPSYSPIFQTFFSLDKGELEQAIQLPGVKATFKTAEIDAAKFDLSLICTEHSEGIRCVFEYNTDLFHPDTIHAMGGHLVKLADSLIKAPEQPIATLDLLSQAEKKQLLSDWNQTHQTVAPIEQGLCLQQVIEDQCLRSSERVAIRQGDRTLTYQALNNQSNQLARHLRSMGVKPNQRIGICLAPSIDAVIGVLAIIKAGAAYVPMDINYPPERLSHIAQDAAIDIVLTHSEGRERFQHLEHVVELDTQSDVWQEHSSDNLTPEQSPNDLLYVVYTSGSTGLPKGAGVSHTNSLNLLDWYTQKYQMTASDKSLVISALGFDLTQKNLFALLTVGGTVVFPDDHIYDPYAIKAAISHHQITLMNCAPSAFYPLLESKSGDTSGYNQLNSLRCVLFGGEPIQLSYLKPWLAQSSCQVVNMYGPTECTDIATSYTLQANDLTQAGQSGLPIGKPSANVQLFVLDGEFQQIVPIGVAGELCIGGTGLGSGYLNNSQQTQTQFIDTPELLTSYTTTNKLYRTGDLVRYRRDGNLEFIARLDGQIKIRGQRIEPGEIESQLGRLEGISEAVVADKTAPNGQTILAAYLVLEASSDMPDAATLRSQLKQHVPDYMVPSAFIAIEQIPLTPNGKINRKALPSPEAKHLERDSYTPPRDELEASLCEILTQVLKIERVGINDHFFEIGGHSLLATQVTSKITEQYGIELPVRAIFEIPQVSGLADLLRSLIPNLADTSNAAQDDDEFEEGVL